MTDRTTSASRSASGDCHARGSTACHIGSLRSSTPGDDDHKLRNLRPGYVACVLPRRADEIWQTRPGLARQPPRVTACQEHIACSSRPAERPTPPCLWPRRPARAGWLPRSGTAGSAAWSRRRWLASASCWTPRTPLPWSGEPPTARRQWPGHRAGTRQHTERPLWLLTGQRHAESIAPGRRRAGAEAPFNRSI
jgi:hypothetical protein